MVNITVPTFNFTEWQGHLIENSISGYTSILGFFFWPIFFLGIIAYLYLKNQSAVVAVVGIIIIFAGFVAEGIFANVPVFTMLMQAIVALVLAGLFVVLYLRRR